MEFNSINKQKNYEYMGQLPPGHAVLGTTIPKELEGVFPNVLREKMHQAGHGATLVVLEACHRLGLLNRQYISQARLIEELGAAYGISRNTILKALSHPAIQHAVERTGRRGRPPMLHKLPTIKALMRRYIGTHEWWRGQAVSDPLPDTAFSSPREHRKAMHEAYILRLWFNAGKEAFQNTMQFLADRLGVSRRTIRAYNKDLNIQVTPEYIEEEVQSGHDWNYLPLKLGEDRRQFLTVELPNGDMLRKADGSVRRFPAVRAVAAKIKGNLIDGIDCGRLWLIEQRANYYAPPQHLQDQFIEKGKYDDFIDR